MWFDLILCVYVCVSVSVWIYVFVFEYVSFLPFGNSQALLHYFSSWCAECCWFPRDTEGEEDNFKII